MQNISLKPMLCCLGTYPRNYDISSALLWKFGGIQLRNVAWSWTYAGAVQLVHVAGVYLELLISFKHNIDQLNGLMQSI